MCSIFLSFIRHTYIAKRFNKKNISSFLFMILCLDFKTASVIQVIWRSTVKRMQNSVRWLHLLVQNWAWSGRYSTNSAMLKVKVVPLNAKQAQRGDKSICSTLTHPDSGWVVKARPRPPYSLEQDPVWIAQEAGWASGPIWIGPENPHTPPNGFRNGISRYFYKYKCLH
jgi:hypothetical protein